MERHEIKALVDGRLAENKKRLDSMQAKADSATGHSDADYQNNMRQLQKEHDELRDRAERLWNTSDADIDTARKEFERYLEGWEARAREMHKSHAV